MAERKTLRSRQPPPNDPDVRREQRLAGVEATQEPYRTIQTSDNTPLRIVRGFVDSTGAKIYGGGFTSSRTGVGRYTVQYNVAFPIVATVTVTMDGGGSAGNSDVLYVYTQTNANFGVACNWPGDGSARDRNFAFVAIGPA